MIQQFHSNVYLENLKNINLKRYKHPNVNSNTNLQQPSDDNNPSAHQQIIELIKVWYITQPQLILPYGTMLIDHKREYYA